MPPENDLRVWSCKFSGHYPVGACAVVVATTLAEAQFMLAVKLEAAGLRVRDDDEWTEIDTTKLSVTILVDGDY